jgi:hypothetical protein
MKNLFYVLTLFALSIATTSCSNDDKTNDSKFKGAWSGTYSGEEDNGTWQATISADGLVSGTFTSINFSNLVIDLTGTVNPQGALNAIYGNMFLTGQFTGTLKENSGSGAWTNESDQLNGTWIGTKE